MAITVEHAMCQREAHAEETKELIRNTVRDRIPEIEKVIDDAIYGWAVLAGQRVGCGFKATNETIVADLPNSLFAPYMNLVGPFMRECLRRELELVYGKWTVKLEWFDSQYKFEVHLTPRS